MFECIFQFAAQYLNPDTGSSFAGNRYLLPGKLNPHKVSYLNS